jgi:hypothetical protein
MERAMRVLLLVAFATAAVFFSAMAERPSIAMPLVVRPGSVSVWVQPITNVCGNNGCVRVQTQRVVKHQKPGNFIPGRH